MTRSLTHRMSRDRSRGLVKDERPCPCRECGHTPTFGNTAGWPVRTGPLTVIKTADTGPSFIDHEYVETVADGRKRYVTQPYPLPDDTLALAVRNALRDLREAGYRVQILPPGYGRHNEGVMFISIEAED